MKIYVSDLIKITDCILFKGNSNTLLTTFSKDTRTIQKGEVYLGIKGNNFDGNNFYKEAILKGASGCILNKDTAIDKEFLDKYDVFIILVDDTIKFLQSIASFKRDKITVPVIGITGSVGKTSTKDLVAGVLEKKYRVLKTKGNLNNYIGLPLMIMNYVDEDILVLEMGMNNLGEISLLSKIAKPNIGVITNIGTSHIGNLGSRENILKAKLEILDGMNKDGYLFINNDNDLLHDWYLKNKDNYHMVTYGVNNESDYFGKNIKLNKSDSTYEVTINKRDELFKVGMPGDAFILNSLCAISIGSYFNVSITDIKKGLLDFKLSSNRMAIEQIGNILVINDAYNANLDSMQSSLNYLGTHKGRKIALLGDMLELGDYSSHLHEKVGECVVKNKIDYLILVGKEVKNIQNKCLSLGFNKNNIFTYNSNKEAFNKLMSILNDGDTLLLKASNGMNFLEIYTWIKDAIK